jgi:hypothetical protein
MALIIYTPGAFKRYDDDRIGEQFISEVAIQSDIVGVEASDLFLEKIIELFTPGNPRGCTNITIPVSQCDSQASFGDTAKTIIYALLQ